MLIFTCFYCINCEMIANQFFFLIYRLIVTGVMLTVTKTSYPRLILPIINFSLLAMHRWDIWWYASKIRETIIIYRAGARGIRWNYILYRNNLEYFCSLIQAYKQQDRFKEQAKIIQSKQFLVPPLLTPSFWFYHVVFVHRTPWIGQELLTRSNHRPQSLVVEGKVHWTPY